MSHQKDVIPKHILVAAWSIALAAIAPMLDSTMINIAIKQLNTTFQTSLDIIQWGVTGYILALATTVPLAGWLMNRFNSKKVFISSVILFGVTSLFVGLSWNVGSFIFFRIMQGGSAGVITTLMSTLLVKVAGREHIGKVMAIVSTPMILGPIFGPVLGGFIIHYLSWQYIFYINIVITMIITPIMLKVLPSFQPFKPESRFDGVGITLIALISIAFIYGVSAAANRATFMNLTTMICLGIGLILILSYILYGLRRETHLVLPLSLFKDKHFSIAGVGLFLANIAILGPMIIFPIFFQTFKHYTEIQAALALMPQGIGMLVTRPLIGKWIDRIGAKAIVLVSVGLTVMATIPFTLVGPHVSIVWLSLFLFIRGLCVGGIMLPLTTDVYVTLDDAQLPPAGVGVNMIENIGSSFGSAMMASVVAMFVTQFGTQLSHQMTAYHLAFLVSVVILLLLVIPGFFLSSKRKASR